MNKVTILALTATAAAAVVAACGGSTKSASNDGTGGDGGGGSANSSSGAASSSDGGSEGDAETTTTPLGDSGYSIVTTLPCTSASMCDGGEECYGTTGFSGTDITITSACASTAPSGGLTASFQLCASATECANGDTCSSLTSALGGGTLASYGAAVPASLSSLSTCVPEGGTGGITNDAGCYVYGDASYCPGTSTHGSSDGSTSTSDVATTTTASDAAGGGD